MAKEKGTIEMALRKAKHHVRTTENLVALGLSEEKLEYRTRLVVDTIQDVLNQLEKVRQCAKKTNCSEVLNMLEAPVVEFGHDWPNLEQAEVPV